LPNGDGWCIKTSGFMFMYFYIILITIGNDHHRLIAVAGSFDLFTVETDQRCVRVYMFPLRYKCFKSFPFHIHGIDTAMDHNFYPLITDKTERVFGWERKGNFAIAWRIDHVVCWIDADTFAHAPACKCCIA